METFQLQGLMCLRSVVQRTEYININIINIYLPKILGKRVTIQFNG